MIFTLTHLLLIYTGIVFFSRLIDHEIKIINPNFIFTISALFVALEIMGFISANHLPRVGSIYLNPNIFSAVSVMMMHIYLRGIGFYLSFFGVLLGGSVAMLTIVPIIFKNIFKYFSILIILMFIFFIENIEVLYMMVERALDLIQLIINGVDMNDTPNIDNNISISAQQRYIYLVRSAKDIANMDNYYELNQFEFREGALLSLVSINPFFGMVAFVFFLFVFQNFISSRRYAIGLVFFVWAFLTPVVIPLYFIIFEYEKIVQDYNNLK